jgi:hypothetical protein
MELRFVPSESTFAYFEALKTYLRRHGKHGPRRSSQKPGILKNRALQIAEAARSKAKPPAEAGAAPIWWSPLRRPPLPQKPPSDISTLHKQ